MRYFDGLANAYFKTAPDGRRLYFPWGSWGRGYVIEADADYERLRRQLSFYQIGLLIAIFVGAMLMSGSGYFAGIMFVPLIVYAVWTRSVIAGLPVADERMSMRDSAQAAAVGWGATILWLIEMIALGFVAVDLLLLFTGVESVGMAILGLIIFGLAAASTAYMIVLRRQAPMASSLKA